MLLRFKVQKFKALKQLYHTLLKYAATWAGIGNAIIGSLLAWAVLGRRTRIMTQRPP